jgi:hypothetical protein
VACVAKFEARRGDASLGQRAWFVRRQGNDAITLLSESEAEVIAWAFNAIDQGFTLSAYKAGTRADSVLSRTYNGPIDGILRE